MIDDIPDLAPPPADSFTISRAPAGGWVIHYDGHVEAAFSCATDLAAWLEKELRPLDPKPAAPERLPNVLSPVEAETLPPRRIWHVFSGGKS